MADSNLANPNGFVDVRRVQGGTTTTVAAAGAGSYDNVTKLRARLTAINSTYYSAKMLNTMTENDMVHAVRQSDDAAGIK